MRTLLLSLVVLALASAGCGERRAVGNFEDGGPGLDARAGDVDASAVDAGAVDASAVDASMSDAGDGAPDASTSPDASALADAGALDAASADAALASDGGLLAFGAACRLGSECASGLCRTSDFPPFCWYTACTASCTTHEECVALVSATGAEGADRARCEPSMGVCDMEGIRLGRETCE